MLVVHKVPPDPKVKLALRDRKVLPDLRDHRASKERKVLMVKHITHGSNMLIHLLLVCPIIQAARSILVLRIIKQQELKARLTQTILGR